MSGSVSATFAYDGVGRRRAKTIGGATTGFLYDGLNGVQELSRGSPSATIVSGLDLDEWFTRTDGAGTKHFLTDVLGSTLGLTDGSGVVQTEYTYEPFGSTTASGVASANTPQFTGRENDGTGLYYYRARYYHPALQRFVSEDPLEFGSGDPNLFSYVSNGPTGYIDPLGLGKLGLIKIVRRIGERLASTSVRSVKSAQNARRRGADVMAPNRRVAETIERGARKPGEKVIHHQPHKEGYRPHYQTRGKRGHTFYTVVPGAGLGDTVAEKTGSETAGHVVDFVNPFSDVEDLLELLEETIDRFWPKDFSGRKP